MSTKVPMTIEGHQQLKDELENLKLVERPNIIRAISEARAHGDLKENAEYHAAKERQGFIESRILLLESILSHAQVIDVTKIPNQGRVIFGSTVEMINIDTDEKSIYKLVSEYEADIKQGKISITSPLARAMIGKSLGDNFSFHAPTGNVEYEILRVDYL